MSLARYFVWVVTWADVQEVCSIAARVVCFALSVLWRTLFLCPELEGSAPQTPHHPFVKGWTESLPRHPFLLWCPFLRSELSFAFTATCSLAEILDRPSIFRHSLAYNFYIKENTPYHLSVVKCAVYHKFTWLYIIPVEVISNHA